MKILNRLAALFVLLALFGCKENLYTGISEQDVNMMVAILEQSGIEAERNKDEQNKYSLRVEASDFTKAVQVLAAKGYPKKQYQSLADVFSNEGIVKTPFEQRARFVHALNQELSRSLSDLDGVVSARVHITLPEVTRFGQNTEKPRAAVLILHQRTRSMNDMKPKIKQLVAHSVSGITYENVTVVMSAVDGMYERNTLAPFNGNGGDKLLETKNKGSTKTTFNEEGDKEPKAFIGAAVKAGTTSGTVMSWLLVIAGLVFAGLSVYLWRRSIKSEQR